MIKITIEIIVDENTSIVDVQDALHDKVKNLEFKIEECPPPENKEDDLNEDIPIFNQELYGYSEGG
jgi:hypothetical protein